MSEIRVAAIVGGHGEVESIPILFHRIARGLGLPRVVQVKPVLRIPESGLAKAGGLEKHVEFAARKIGGNGGIFILMDCDSPRGCPKNDGPIWLHRAQHA